MNNPFINWYYYSFFEPYRKNQLSFNKCLLNLIHREKLERHGYNYLKKQNANTRKDIAKMAWNIRKTFLEYKKKGACYE
jgi:hypothetical protein